MPSQASGLAPKPTKNTKRKAKKPMLVKQAQHVVANIKYLAAVVLPHQLVFVIA